MLESISRIRHHLYPPHTPEITITLRERGVPVELVNGITAGLAGATGSDIPLTLRGVSRGVTLVTAHTQDDSPLNWRALAEGGTTLVIYMGVAKLGEIRRQLLEVGMAADMPVAMIENASLPAQRECRSNLSGMQDDAQAFALKSPAILVIGRVVEATQMADLLNQAYA
ncbi:MAG: Siroheme synthase [Pseudomonas fluorescens]|nr:MAG: Siroheme synthase [Pseudomonas fluorescens]